MIRVFCLKIYKDDLFTLNVFVRVGCQEARLNAKKIDNSASIIYILRELGEITLPTSMPHSPS